MKHLFKRSLDVLVATTLLILAFPVLAAIAVAVRMAMGSPILFTQDRPGKNGDIFRLFKFRTMKPATNSNATPLSDEQRMTKFGGLLRSTSLDELPELFNILRGDMSLVGPRPLLPEYLPLYSDEQKRRHNVRPGLTGWAQVNGRNTTNWTERFALDVWYVDNWTAWLDVKILAKTVAVVLSRSGVSEEGAATMTPFSGNASADAVRDLAEDSKANGTNNT
jgi:sugar transferase EpsL